MNKGIIFSLLFFLLISAFALAPVFALTPLDADEMDARVLIMNTVSLERTGSHYAVSEATGTLTWFPRDTWVQDVTDIAIEPSAAKTTESIVFQWQDPLPQESFRVSANIRTKNAIVPVRDHILFPLAEVPPDVAQYLSPGEITDTNPEIQALAQELVTGKTDAYEAVFTLADWTTSNVNYSLASVGLPASQKASAVLASRQGKCDELTALFISMNRAVGIPARFAAGYAYTNSPLFSTAWGGHGWAEVWLPGQGWVPFDVTYGEYGYLDAGHVTLKTSHDAKETSIDYRAKGNDFRLDTEPLHISVTPTDLRQNRDDIITIHLEAPYQNVGFGSTALILATVRNNKDYYVSTRLDIGKTTNSDLLSGNSKNVLLRPRESRTVPFLVKIDDGLEPGYRYEFPFKVHTRLGSEAAINIFVRQDAPVYDRSSFDEEIARYASGTVPRAKLIVTCTEGKPSYAGNEVTHTCTVRGVKGSAVEICQKNCTRLQLQEGTFTLMTRDEAAGVFTRAYTAKVAGESTTFYVRSRSIAPAQILANLTHASSATPKTVVPVTLNLAYKGAVPKNVSVELQAKHASATQKLDDLSRPAILTFTVPGDMLRPGENVVTARISAVDELGTPTSELVQGKIVLTDVSALDRVLFAVEDAGYWLEDLFT